MSEDEIRSFLVRIDNKLEAHLTEEEIWKNEILAIVSRSGVRVDELVKSVAAMVLAEKQYHETPCKPLSQAFLKDDEGNPDCKGHAKAHAIFVENAERNDAMIGFIEAQMRKHKERSDDFRSATRIVMATIAAIVVAWVGAQIWKGVLDGPSKSGVHLEVPH